MDGLEGNKIKELGEEGNPRGKKEDMEDKGKEGMNAWRMDEEGYGEWALDRKD